MLTYLLFRFGEIGVTMVLSSVGASAAKEPGHFEVRTGDGLVSRRPQNTKAANAAEIVSLSK